MIDLRCLLQVLLVHIGNVDQTPIFTGHAYVRAYLWEPNKASVPDSFPLPHTEELHVLLGATRLSKLGMASKYHSGLSHPRCVLGVSTTPLLQRGLLSKTGARFRGCCEIALAG